jgi:hypothetical protein
MRYVLLFLSGVLIAFAGLIARWPHPTKIEHLFVFAAGFTNLTAIWDIGYKAFLDGHSKIFRGWLTIELIFLSAILGLDIHLVLRGCPNFLLFCALILVFVSLSYVTMSDRKDKLSFLASSLLFVASLYLFPALIKLLVPIVDNLWGNVDWWKDVMRNRIYTTIHLFYIPAIYSIVDHRVVREDNKWEPYLFLDNTLFWVGLACMISGLLYASLATGPIEPLYEAGAAAVMLFVGNAWYVKVKSRQ